MSIGNIPPSNLSATLYNQSDGHNKFYTASIEQEGGKWTLVGIFGRIGTPGTRQVKMRGATFETACAAYEDLLTKKLRAKPPYVPYRYLVAGDSGSKEASEFDEDELIDRATKAYFTYINRAGDIADIPATSACRILTTTTGNYVVLANGFQNLCVFKITAKGGLRRVEPDKWPDELKEEE
jgi:predicted DNA-binding WGR domain protein